MSKNATVSFPGRETGEPPAVEIEAVSALPLVIDKMVTTRDGELQLMLKGEVIDHESANQVRQLMRLQREGVLRVSFQPVQIGLELGEAQ